MLPAGHIFLRKYCFKNEIVFISIFYHTFVILQQKRYVYQFPCCQHKLVFNISFRVTSRGQSPRLRKQVFNISFRELEKYCRNISLHKQVFYTSYRAFFKNRTMMPTQVGIYYIYLLEHIQQFKILIPTQVGILYILQSC